MSDANVPEHFSFTAWSTFTKLYVMPAAAAVPWRGVYKTWHLPEQKHAKLRKQLPTVPPLFS